MRKCMKSCVIAGVSPGRIGRSTLPQMRYHWKSMLSQSGTAMVKASVVRKAKEKPEEQARQKVPAKMLADIAADR